MGTRGAFALAIALSAGGCGLVPSRPIVVVYPAQGSLPEFPVTLVDPAGFVRDVAIGGPAVGGSFDRGGSVTQIRGIPTAAVVSWIGGACDVRATATVELRESTIVVAMTTDQGRGCILLGIPRRLTLDFVEPIGARELALDRAAP